MSNILWLGNKSIHNIILITNTDTVIMFKSLLIANTQLTCSLESQLLADHCSINPVPAVITDRAPDSTITDLHCPLTTALTTNQTYSTICAACINGWKLKLKYKSIDKHFLLSHKTTIRIHLNVLMINMELCVNFSWLLHIVNIQ